MITHYDIKTETQKLKDVLSVEGVNIPTLLQVIKPGGMYFYGFYYGQHFFVCWQIKLISEMLDLIYVLVV